jgi:hypothetical protein
LYEVFDLDQRIYLSLDTTSYRRIGLRQDAANAGGRFVREVTIIGIQSVVRRFRFGSTRLDVSESLSLSNNPLSYLLVF